MSPRLSLIKRKRLLAHRTSWLLAAGLACVPLGATIGAHEIGTTRVVASLTRDDTYTIDVTTDAGALLGRLELASKRPRSSPASAAEYQRAFTALCGELPHHVAVVFDDAPDVPRADCTVDAPGPRPAIGCDGKGVLAARPDGNHVGQPSRNVGLAIKTRSPG